MHCLLWMVGLVDGDRWCSSRFQLNYLLTVVIVGSIVSRLIRLDKSGDIVSE